MAQTLANKETFVLAGDLELSRSIRLVRLDNGRFVLYAYAEFATREEAEAVYVAQPFLAMPDTSK